MRRIAFAAALLLAACSESKPVDLTAHFAREGSTPITVKAAANGDSRVEAGDRVFLRLGGKEYLVQKDAKGSYAVALDDAIAVLGATPPGQGPRPQPGYSLGQGGQENIAGVQGKVWKVFPKDVPSLTNVDAVIANDPGLAPMGKGLAMQSRFTISVNSGPMGGLGNLEKALIELFDKGPVIRFGTALRLDGIEKKPVAASELLLPQPVLSREQFGQRVAVP